MEGLAEDELRSLCLTLFNFSEREIPEIAGAIRGATLGNPLAVRSALRGVLTAGTIAANETAQGKWRIGQRGEALINGLKNNVRVLPKGMAAHLSRTERVAAEQFACLGEVFSAEATGQMLRTAFGLYPDDEEIAGLLESACRLLGKEFEAE